jgi:L-lactate permease
LLPSYLKKVLDAAPETSPPGMLEVLILCLIAFNVCLSFGSVSNPVITSTEGDTIASPTDISTLVIMLAGFLVA